MAFLDLQSLICWIQINSDDAPVKEQFKSYRFFSRPPIYNNSWDNGTYPGKYGISINLTSDTPWRPPIDLNENMT